MNDYHGDLSLITMTEPRGLALARMSQRNRPKMPKNSKNYKMFAKTQIIDANKVIGFNLNAMYFYSSFLSILIQLKRNQKIQ